MEVKIHDRKRRFYYGTNAVVLTIAVLAIAVVTYGIVDRLHLRWDLTANRDFSLSEQTEKILKNLDQEVKILAFFRRGEDLDDLFIRRRIDDLLKEYSSRSSKISYRLVDPDLEIELAVQYNITTDGTIVFLSGKNRKEIYKSALFDYSQASEKSLPAFVGEGLFTNALLKVKEKNAAVVCFLEGHEERSLKETTPAGFSQIGDYLKKNNYDVKTLNLVTEQKVPKDCSLLVIAGPQKNIASAEEEVVNNYLAKSRPLLLLGDPLTPATPTGVLEKLGLAWNNDLVLDPERHFLLGPHYPAPILSDHKITQGLQEMNPILSLARSLQIIKKEEKGPQVVETLLTSTDEAWGETNLQEGSEPRFDKVSDARGPLTLGVAVKRDEKPLAIVVGDSNFAANELIQAPGNLDLFLNMVGWLVGDEEKVAIRPKTPEFRNINLTPAKVVFIQYFTQAGYPLLVLATGGIYWWRRKRRV
ncbi:MAG: GldG family protein [Deltaproteobacteria bacterium]|nr:GldG family protein [Deltaproteobacteria bacterium]